MGKNLIQQARGKGGPSYRARSFAYAGSTRLRAVTSELVSGTIVDILKSAGHSSPLIKVDYEDGISCLMQAPEFVRVGDKIQSGPGGNIHAGNVLHLKDDPEGTPVFNIESQPGDGGKFCRTSGSAARVDGMYPFRIYDKSQFYVRAHCIHRGNDCDCISVSIPGAERRSYCGILYRNCQFSWNSSDQLYN